MVCATSTSTAQPPSSTGELRIDGATVVIDCDCANGPALDLLRPWITDAAVAIKTYYGRFPVKQLRIAVTGTGGRGVQSGTTYSWDSPLIRVSVGRDSTAADLKADWVMTHEMAHLTQPELDERHAWVQEGLAVYVEPIARAQAGQLTEEKIWGDMMRDMAKGLPAADDRGLDNTHTWGRTYWGGAMLFLLADVEIRAQTGNRHGLQEALRAMLEARDKVSDLRRWFEVGDQETGTRVLVTLYDRMRDASAAPNLADLRIADDAAAGRSASHGILPVTGRCLRTNRPGRRSFRGQFRLTPLTGLPAIEGGLFTMEAIPVYLQDARQNRAFRKLLSGYFARVLYEETKYGSRIPSSAWGVPVAGRLHGIGLRRTDGRCATGVCAKH